MFFSPAMRSAVLQTTAICIISMLYTEHKLGVFDAVVQDEGYKNMTASFDATMSPNLAPGTQNTSMTLDAGNSTTKSPLNTTTFPLIDEPFYTQRFPREVFIVFVLSTLEYWWLMGLERILPARPRPSSTPSYASSGKEGVVVEDDEGREEEVVKKWIATGRVRRSSLNLCNTFLKWVLDMTVCVVVTYSIAHVLRHVISMRSIRGVGDDLLDQIGLGFFTIYLCFTPLIRLAAFVLVPAHRQMVFSEGVQLVATVFSCTVVRAFAGWAVKTEAIQMAMRNTVEENRRAKWGV
ncbi:hypothetical protein PtrSN002B_002171 [Pyrenophora tritici-repentis]|uniref:Uncharacterized protein n=1 Tax=Pyrenophora tritici-repentis TaxID=45151 RepID=A0A2W1FP25_9PLEO|nr:hypothetical protein PtrM4_109700 [Pyrenophora tritici-repentis]KAI0576944.1 hypothetical protein Alg130_08580 [Pyrenophora tritici-repentis]KAI0585124.1 hypothetical protein Alg215_02680 [Pyrenophora tritici-repentis]KAI0614013.1 hypothetical protein TUN205_01712 [Pyrenophora tritici-repentis]KAI0627041.1 hypothetical protein TUN199_00910 [Pyrenophora tritici-repentis]